MNHRFLAIAAAACLIPLSALGAGAAPAAIAPEVLKAEGERIAVMAASRSAVLAVFSRDGGGGGSGVVISPDGYALTNFHVVLPCGNAMKCGMSDGKLYDAVLVGIDPTGDVALVKLFGRERFPAAEIGDSDGVQSGDWVFAMGNPFLLSTDFQPTVTYGIISGTHRYQYPAGTILEYTDCLQTDASINPGNSGGPLFDARGRLVGINGRASFYKRGRVSVGVGYAISINQVKNFLGILRGGRIADHATLGAVVGLDGENRVVVTDILESSDAYRRGLRYGDEIVSFAARAIETPNAFKNVLGILPKGWRVPLSFRRDGRRHNVLVRLQGLHSESELLERIAAEHEDSPMPIPKPGPGPEDKPGDRPGKTPGHDGGKKKPKDEFPDPQKAVMEALHRKAPLPAVVLKHFEEKRGYANYFFNKLNRDRVWKAWTARCDLAGQQGPWSISGRLPDGTPLRIALNAADALLKLPSRSWKWTAADPVDATLSPPGSGGLLMALSLWRRLAVEGPDRFGDVSYLGSMPLPVRDGSGRDGLVDVLSALHSGVECRFMFDPAEGNLLAIEMYTAEDSDPCEIYFSDYHEVGDRFLPQTMEVRYGDDAFGTFRLESYQFEKNL
jgi:S1-C subfamily serine protease